MEICLLVAMLSVQALLKLGLMRPIDFLIISSLVNKQSNQAVNVPAITTLFSI